MTHVGPETEEEDSIFSFCMVMDMQFNFPIYHFLDCH